MRRVVIGNSRFGTSDKKPSSGPVLLADFVDGVGLDERRDVTSLVKVERHFAVLDCVPTYCTISAEKNDLRNRSM